MIHRDDVSRQLDTSGLPNWGLFPKIGSKILGIILGPWRSCHPKGWSPKTQSNNQNTGSSNNR